MAKSSKSKDDDKKRKSSDESRTSDGQVRDVRVTKDWLRGDLARVKETAKGVSATIKSTDGDGVIKGGSVSVRSSDGKIQTGSITIRSADGAVVNKKAKHEKIDISALLRASTIKGGLAENFREKLPVYTEGRAFKGMDIAEIQARIERMETYHAKTKALFSSFLKDCSDSVFSGALAGNTRKNKLKKKNGTSESGDVKKAH